MDNWTRQIVEFIRTNRLSTTDVADCLGKTGAIEGLMPVTRGLLKVGEVFWAYAQDNSNWILHKQLREAPKGSVVVVEEFNCENRALFGALVTEFLVEHRGVEAVVVVGLVRDAPDLLAERRPLWCRGFTPLGCFKDPPARPVDPEVEAARRQRYDGAIAVCDDCGVVIVPPDKIGPEFMEALKQVQERERRWFELMHQGLDTFEIVCEGKGQ